MRGQWVLLVAVIIRINVETLDGTASEFQEQCEEQPAERKIEAHCKEGWLYSRSFGEAQASLDQVARAGSH